MDEIKAKIKSIKDSVKELKGKSSESLWLEDLENVKSLLN